MGTVFLGKEEVGGRGREVKRTEEEGGKRGTQINMHMSILTADTSKHWA